jgi:hypothetical protein
MSMAQVQGSLHGENVIIFAGIAPSKASGIGASVMMDAPRGVYQGMFGVL